MDQQLTAGQYVEITRRNGSFVEGTVVYDRGGVIRYRDAVGQGPRWVNRADVADLVAYPVKA
jgi:hypothetical protein